MTTQLHPYVIINTLANMTALYPPAKMSDNGVLYYATDDGPFGQMYVLDLAAQAWKPTGGGGGGAGGSSYEYIFSEGDPQSGNVYGDWAQLMAVIAALPQGACPRIRFIKNATIPSAGMPAEGWGMFFGSWVSFTPVTAAVKVTVPDGVRIANLSSIEYGLHVEVQPSTTYGVFNYTIPGLPWVLAIGLGAALSNTGSASAIIPGPTDYVVIAVNFSSITAVPPSTAPFVTGAGGVVIGAQPGVNPYGQLPNNWVDGTGTLIYQNSTGANNPLTPGWVGPVLSFNTPASRTVIFQPGGTTNGNVYATWPEVVQAVDRADGAAMLWIDDSLAPAEVSLSLNGHGKLTIAGALGVPTTLTVLDGYVLKNVREITGNLTIEATTATSYAMEYDESKELIVSDGAGLSLKGGSTLPLFVAPDGMQVTTKEYGRILSAAGPVAAIQLTATKSLAYYAWNSRVGTPPASNAFAASAAESLYFTTDASGFDFSAANPNCTATLTTTLNDQATYESYDAANPADWSGSAPATVKEALDRIAAKITPIP